MIRKTISAKPGESVLRGLDLEELAQFEVSSEDPAHPLENALRPGTDIWSASEDGEQSIRVRFDAPQDVQRVHLRFDESRVERTQEFLLSWLPDHETAWRELRRQQFNFSPEGSVTQSEKIELALKAARQIELRIKPRIGGGGRASLTYLAIGGTAG